MDWRRLNVRRIEDLLLATGGNREFRPVQMSRRGVRGELAVATVGGLTLTCGEFRADIHVSGTWSNDKLTFGVLLVARDIEVFGKSARAGDLVVAGKGKEIDGRYRDRLEYLVVNVGKSEVADVAEAHDRKIDPELLDSADLLRLDDRRAARLMERVRPVAEQLRKGTFETTGSAAQRGLADDLLLEFTRGLCCVGSDRKPGWPRDFVPRLVQRAEEWLMANPSQAHEVRQLALHLGVSPRQLYRSFHAAVGMSPARYLKRYRMTQARLELQEADPAETTVTNVAASWGFWELGRFAGEYRRLFGERPSRTLRSFSRAGGSRRRRGSRCRRVRLEKVARPE
ncbi:MAG: helix-turn-helix domain-containing protein [Planctomycetota bacterium]|jgi:AraC family ethanolamine operon transcriptional activator